MMTSSMGVMTMSDEIKTKKVEIIYTLELEDYIDFVSPIDNPNLHKIKAEAEAAAIQKIKDKFTRTIDPAVVWALVFIIGLVIAAFMVKMLFGGGGGVHEVTQAVTTAINTSQIHTTVITKTITEHFGTSSTTYTTLITSTLP